MKTLFTYNSLVLLLFFLISSESYCQISIHGQVQEDEGNALPYTNIILFASMDSSLEQGLVIKEGGEYQIDNFDPENQFHYIPG